MFLFPVNDSIGSTLRPRSTSARRDARVPNGENTRERVSLGPTHESGFVVANRIKKKPDGRERDLEPSINFPDYIVPTCGGTLEARRVRALLATALKLFNCTAR